MMKKMSKVIALMTVDEKFEELHRVAFESEYYRATEKRYIEKYGVDVKAIGKKLYVASQSYKSIKFLSYEHILELVSILMRDKKIHENFFNLPVRTQEDLLREGYQITAVDTYWSFMVALKAANYPSLFLLTADFVNLEQMLEKINEVRRYKIEIRSVDSSFKYLSAVCSKRYSENFGGTYALQSFGVTYFFLLASVFGFDLMKSILNSLIKNDTLPAFAIIIKLAENWDELKDYPVDWAVSMMSE
jgi:hypothetical protein